MPRGHQRAGVTPYCLVRGSQSVKFGREESGAVLRVGLGEGEHGPWENGMQTVYEWRWRRQIGRR